MKVNSVDKEAVPGAPGPFSAQAKVTGSRTANLQPSVQELKFRAVSGHFCQALPTVPAQAPPLCLESWGPYLTAKHSRPEVKSRVVTGLSQRRPNVQLCTYFPDQD